MRFRFLLAGMLAAGMLIAGTIAAPAQRKQGSPLEHLPPNIEMLSYFGERPDIAPDNQHIAFMEKSFGDAMVIDLKTRITRCLTCSPEPWLR